MLLPSFRRPIRPKGTLILQERDLRILQLVYAYRCLDSYALRLLLNHQGSKWALGQRLQKMYQHKLLDRPPRQVILRLLEGERHLIYAIGREGARVLAERYGIPIGNLRWTQKNNEVGDLHLRHALAISRFRACLRLAIPHDAPKEGGIDYSQPYLLPWQQGDELKVKVALLDKAGRRALWTLTPDGYFGVQKAKAPPNRSYFFVELQLSTPTAQRFVQAKGMAYREAWQIGAYTNLLGIKGFRVLIVAQTENKKETLQRYIREWLAKETSQPWGLWLFTSEERFSLQRPASILEPIWQIANEERLLSLLE